MVNITLKELLQISICTVQVIGTSDTTKVLDTITGLNRTSGTSWYNPILDDCNVVMISCEGNNMEVLIENR